MNPQPPPGGYGPYQPDPYAQPDPYGQQPPQQYTTYPPTDQYAQPQSGAPYQSSGAPYQASGMPYQQPNTGYQAAPPPPGPPPGPQFGGQQPWQQPTPPVKKASPLPWILGGVAALVVLCLVGVFVVVNKLSDDKPDTPIAQPGTGPSATAAPTGSPTGDTSPTGDAPTGGKYGAPGNLCGSVDLNALGDWASTKDSATPSERSSAGSKRSECAFKMHSAAGVLITLDVRAEIYPTDEDAKDWWDAAYDVNKKYYEADITDFGGKAAGFNRDWDIGSKTSDYTIRFVDGNLVLTAILVTFDKQFTPKDTIKAKAIAQFKTNLNAIPKQ